MKKHKVISIDYKGGCWKTALAERLDELAESGWKPILYGDSGGQSTVILEREEK